ncbi:MAG: Maf family protein [Chloroflexi bacterium]|nr:Maf family protein [Chloroflexota bacterium]
MPDRIILASASPRRRGLLAQLGVQFEAHSSNVDEEPLPGESPTETQRRVTLAKAETVAVGVRGLRDQWVVIASDTTVLLDDAMLNKPVDEAEAWSMLRRLRGRTHVVQSCLVLLKHQADGEERCHLEILRSGVRLREYSDAEIAAYIATGDPFDKAGSYAAQHDQFKPVAEITGCPLNVIGLSLCRLREHLPHLPECERVCAAWFGRSCAEWQVSVE